MKRVYWFSLIVVIVASVSCSSQKDIAYFHGLNASRAELINKYYKTGHEAKIGVGDMLSITVNGLDPLAVAPFNLPMVSYATPGSDQLSAVPTLQSYLVDVNGNVNFPVIGTIRLAGLKKSEAIKFISDELAPYLKNAIVTIQFMNYRITVLGEVAKPGQYSINNERATILDALGMAGDMTVYGVRNNVLLTRETNGKLEFARLNLNTDEIFMSPYFYLQQNDILYVEPNNVKSVGSQNINLYLSGITTFITTVAFLISITK